MKNQLPVDISPEEHPNTKDRLTRMMIAVLTNSAEDKKAAFDAAMGHMVGKS